MRLERYFPTTVTNTVPPTILPKTIELDFPLYSILAAK